MLRSCCHRSTNRRCRTPSCMRWSRLLPPCAPSPRAVCTTLSRTPSGALGCEQAVPAGQRHDMRATLLHCASTEHIAKLPILYKMHVPSQPAGCLRCMMPPPQICDVGRHHRPCRRRAAPPRGELSCLEVRMFRAQSGWDADVFFCFFNCWHGGRMRSTAARIYCDAPLGPLC